MLFRQVTETEQVMYFSWGGGDGRALMVHMSAVHIRFFSVSLSQALPQLTRTMDQPFVATFLFQAVPVF